MSPEVQPVDGGRSDKQGGGQGSGEQGCTVRRAAPGRQPIEVALEWQNQQEREHHLDPRERNPQLLEQLDQLPISTLVCGLTVGINVGRHPLAVPEMNQR